MFRPAASALILALYATALPLPTASAQPAPPAPAKISILTVGLLYVDNKPLQEELKLSDDQVKKLSEHRDSWYRDYGMVVPPDRVTKVAEMSKDNDKALGNILKPEQLKRFRQLTLHAVEKEYGGRALRYVEVAEALELTEDQQDKLRTAKAEDVLTKEQQNQWQEMLGEPFKGTLRATFPGGPFGGGGRGGPRFPTPPQYLTYVTARPVQDEIKLTDDQRGKAREWRRQWYKAMEDYPQLSDDQFQKAQATSKEIDGALAEMLKPEQMKRLMQIAVQESLRLNSQDLLFILPDVVKELKITDEQQKQIDEVRTKRHTAQGDLYLTGEGSDTIAKTVEAYRKETHEQLTKLLTEEQRGRLKDVVGEPVARPLNGRSSFISPFGGGRGGLVSIPLAVSGLAYCEEKAMIAELRLSEVQVKKLAELERKYAGEIRQLGPGGRGGPIGPGGGPAAEAAKKRQEVYDKTEKAVAEVLEPHQLKRLKQVTLQVMTTGPSAGPLRGGYTVMRYPEVVQALKLTEEQKEDLAAGDELTDVLTKEQKEKWKEFVGEPFKGEINRFGGGPRFFGGQPEPEVLAYLGLAVVQTELKLTDGQRGKLTEAVKHWEDATKDLASLSLTDYQKKVEEATQAAEKDANALLQPQQAQRFQQIRRQQVRKQGGLDALLAIPEVQTALTMTDAQKSKEKAVAEDDAKIRQLIFADPFVGFGPGFPGGGGRGGRGGAFPGGGFAGGPANVTLEKLTKVTDGKLTALLTDVQQTKLKEVLGEPFAGELTRNFGMGGGGFFLADPFSPPR